MTLAIIVKSSVMRNAACLLICFLISSYSFGQWENVPNGNPYKTEEVSFVNAKAGVTLSGTLSVPEETAAYAAVVLIAGNGRNNRDAEFQNHKPFLTITDYLVQHKIAVLRFDKRGVGQSGGNFDTATSADFAADAEAAFDYLLTRKEIDHGKIGLIGHSEGALLASMIAARNHNVAFIVLLAGPGLPGDELLLLQQESIAKAKGTSAAEIEKSRDLNRKAFAIVKQYTDPDQLKLKMTAYIEAISKNDPDKPESMTQQQYVDAQVNRIVSPWMVSFLRYDPAVALQKVTCPVLALNGSKDLQVPPQQNLAAIKAAFAKSGNKQVTLKELPGLNHLFQECNTGLPSEYGTIEQSISSVALEEMGRWMGREIRKLYRKW